MLRSISLLVSVIGFSAGISGASQPRSEPDNIPQVIRNLPEGHEGPAAGWRSGTVKAIGESALTVEFNDPFKETSYEMDNAGRIVRTITFIYPPLAEKKLKLAPALATGKVVDARGCGAYRASDVRVGDRVAIDYSRSKAGEWTCESISILRRPAGKVPAAPHDGRLKVAGYAWHEYCQSHQDFEEKGTPIPLKFLSDYAQRVAPMPREAKPRP